MTVNEDDSIILLIGGYSSTRSFANQILVYNLVGQDWHFFNPVKDKGVDFPTGIYGHSTVYHSPTRSFYIYGGITYGQRASDIHVSNKLYSLNYKTKTWSVVPIYSSQAHPQHYNSLMSSAWNTKPPPSVFHSSVTTSDYLVVIGGQQPSSLFSENEFQDDEVEALVVSLYVYRCNLWINIYNKHAFVDMVEEDIDITIASAAGIDHEGFIYMMGGISKGFGVARGNLVRMNIPKDACELYSSTDKSQICKTTLGCAHCSVYAGNGDNSTFCYSNNMDKVGCIRNENIY